MSKGEKSDTLLRGFPYKMLSLLFSFFPLKDLPTLQFSFDKLLSIFWLSQKLEITLETVEVLESKKHLYSCFLFLLLFSHGKAFRFLKLCKERDIKVFSGSWNCIKAWKLANSLTSTMPPSKYRTRKQLYL